MDLSEIYEVFEGQMRGAMRARALEGFDELAVIGGRIPDHSLPFKVYVGRKSLDFMWTQHACVFLVSSRVVEAFRAEGVTGWKTYPVDLCGIQNERIEGYHGFAVTGRCGPIDNSRCTPSIKMTPSGLVTVWLGMHFDPDSWDGSDVFLPCGTAHVMMTEKVRRLIEGARLSNAELHPVTEVPNPSRNLEEWRKARAKGQ